MEHRITDCICGTSIKSAKEENSKRDSRFPSLSPDTWLRIRWFPYLLAIHTLNDTHSRGSKDERESNSWFQLTWRKETADALDDTWEITVTNSIYSFVAIAHKFLPPPFFFLHHRVHRIHLAPASGSREGSSIRFLGRRNFPRVIESLSSEHRARVNDNGHR